MSNDELTTVTKYNVERIKSGKLGKVELCNMLRNYLKNETVSPEDKQQISTEIEIVLRERFPRDAKKIFGARDVEARETLGEIFSRIEADFDLSGNVRHKNKIKTGGNVISGDAYVYTYISYRNVEGIVTHLALSQPTAEDDLQILVKRYQVGNNSSEEISEYGIDKLAEAESLYRKHLGEIVIP